MIARMAELASELSDLAAVEGDLSDDQETRWSEANAEFDGLKTKRTALEARAQVARDAVRSAADNQDNRLPGDGTYQDKNVNIRKNSGNPYDLKGVVDVRAVLGDLSEEAGSIRGEYRDRARKAIESAPFAEDAHRNTAMKHVDSDGSGMIAAHILKTGSPAYRSAFNKYLSNPSNFGWQLDAEERTAMSTTGANGGFLIPFMLDPTIMLTNDGATNPFRQIATIKTTMTNSWNGVTSAGVTAEWLAENTSAADASPVVAQAPIPVYKAAAFVQASFEVIEDSGIAGDIAMLIADARDRLEATAFATGSGSGQPTGVITALGLVTASRVAGTSGAGGAADFVVADVFAAANALPPRFRANSSWVAEQSIYNKIRLFATGTGVQTGAFWAELGVDRPPLLIGRPAYESSAMDNTIVSGSNDDILVIGDFKKGYFIVDRIGMTLAYEPLMKSQSTGRPDGSVGWFAHWRVGANAVVPNAFRMLRL